MCVAELYEAFWGMAGSWLCLHCLDLVTAVHGFTFQAITLYSSATFSTWGKWDLHFSLPPGNAVPFILCAKVIGHSVKAQVNIFKSL